MSRQYIPPHRALISKARERAVAVVKHREEKMKIRLVVALVGLAISFALPTFAQQTNTPDPQLREAIVALHKKYDDAFDNGDAAALAACFTKDAVLVNETGPVYGRERSEEHTS